MTTIATEALDKPRIELAEQPQHSLWQSVGLHLLPGVVFLLGYILITPILVRLGYPSFLGLFVTAGLIEIPLLLGYLYYQGYKENGRYTLKNIVLYKEPLPVWQYLVFGLLLLVWAMVTSAVINLLLDARILEAVFSWLPEWFIFNSFAENLDQYSRQALVTTILVAIIVGGFGATVVQELYFRGYLLPRMSHLGKRAPLLNAFLFGVYHLVTPWRILSITVSLLPLAYVVHWKKNVYIGIVSHFLIGTLPLILFLAVI